MEKMVTKKKKKEPSVEISKDSKNDSKSNSKDSKNDSKDSKPSKHDNKKSSDTDHSSQQDSERSTSSDSEKSTKSNETSNVTPNETHKDNDTNIVTVVSEMRVDILRILMMLKHITKDVVAQKKNELMILTIKLKISFLLLKNLKANQKMKLILKKEPIQPLSVNVNIQLVAIPI